MKKTCIALLALGFAVGGCTRSDEDGLGDLLDILTSGGGGGSGGAWDPDQMPPELTLRSPGPEATLVPPNTKVVLYLSEQVIPRSVDHSSFVLRDPRGRRVPATLELSGPGKVILTPDEDLDPDARYTVTVQGFRDLAKNAMWLHTWSFTTGPVGIGSWRPLADVNGPQSLIPVSVWTGSEWIVWGTNGGGRYTPATGTWRGITLTGGPTGSITCAVWTGSEMLVWPSRNNQGHRYDPVADTWTKMSTVGIPSPSYSPVVVWTGSRLLVWSGIDGASYDPATDLWTPMSIVGAPSVRVAPKFAWTGTELIVWGGLFQSPWSYSPTPVDTGAIYSPSTDTWRPMSAAGAPLTMSSCAVWSGTELIVWSSSPMTGGRYDPVANVWRSISTPPYPYPAVEPVVWTGTEMILGAARGYGGRYNPSTDSWSTTTYVGEPLGVTHLAAVWTGSEVLAWGCWEGDLWTGGAYKP